MKEALRKEMEKQIPEIAEQYIENIESFLNYLKSTYGKGLIVDGNKYSWFKGEDGSLVSPKQHEHSKSKFREFVGKRYFVNKNVVRSQREYKNHEEFMVDVNKSVWVLNKEAIQSKALEYAQKAVRQWEDKIIEKLGDLQEIDVPYYHGTYFVIKGTRKGSPKGVKGHIVYDVEIRQQMIVNYRYETHTVFNQFPARIYVDGESWSASKYSKYFNN